MLRRSPASIQDAQQVPVPTASLFSVEKAELTHRDDRVLVSVIVPTLNEVDNVGVLIEELSRAFAQEPYGFEILVADGGSADGTRAAATATSHSHPVMLVECSGQSGLAGDVLEAARQASGEVVVVLDADFSHPPGRAPELARAVLEGRADVAVGSRYCRDGATPGWPLRRRLMSLAAGSLVLPLQDTHDPLAGFFAVTRARLIETCGQARGFKLLLELLLRGGEALRVTEIGIEFRDRQRGTSKMALSEVGLYLQSALRLVAGEVGQHRVARFALVSLLGSLVDLLTLGSLLGTSVGLAGAQAISFLTASLATYWGHARWGLGGASTGIVRLGWRTHVRFLAVALMAFALRGAVIGHALIAPLPWHVTLPLAAGCAALVQFLGSCFFVFDTHEPRPGNGLRWRIGALGLLVYLLLLRLGYLGLPSLLVEEAYYWNYAQHLDLSYLDHPPMVALLIGAGTWLFGDTEFGVRFPALVCSLVWTWFGYRMACNLFDRAVGLRSVLLLAALPLFVCYGFFMTPDAPLLACWAGALFFLERALLGGKRSAWYGVGICLGLGLLSKYTILLLVPATLAFVVLDPRSRVWLRRKEPYLALGLALLLFSPVLVWNARHEWVSFVFQGPRRWSSGFDFGLHKLCLFILLMLGPTAVVAAFHALRRGPHDADTARGISASRSRVLFSRLLVLVPLAVFAVFSLNHRPKGNWAGPALLAALPLIAYHTMDGRRRMPAERRSLLSQAWAPTLATLTVVYGLSLQYLVGGVPGMDYPQGVVLFGWSDLAAQIEKIEDAVELESGEEPLVVGMDKYNIASQLAFYRTRQSRDEEGIERHEGVEATSGRQWFGKESLMFGYWPIPGDKEGRTLILVGDASEDLSGESVTESFEHLTPVTRVLTEQNGKRSKDFFYRIGYGFLRPAS